MKLDHTWKTKNDLKKSDKWKTQLTIAFNVISSRDNDEERVMHSKNDNIEFTIYDNVDESIEKISELLLKRHRIELETPMRGSDFIFDCVHLLC